LRFLKRLLAQREQRACIEGLYGENRTVMIVSPLSGEYDTLRVLSILEGWHLRIARTLEAALELRRREEIAVIVYDQDLPGIGWRKGVLALLRDFPPACLVLLSSVVQEGLRLRVVVDGGYDVAGKPIQGEALVSIVNGFFALASDINSSWADPQNGVPVRSRRRLT
jgi:DNA-binding response OmpR family regulator